MSVEPSAPAASDTPAIEAIDGGGSRTCAAVEHHVVTGTVDGAELTVGAEVHALQVLALQRAVEVEFLAAEDRIGHARRILAEPVESMPAVAALDELDRALDHLGVPAASAPAAAPEVPAVRSKSTALVVAAPREVATTSSTASPARLALPFGHGRSRMMLAAGVGGLATIGLALSALTGPRGPGPIAAAVAPAASSTVLATTTPATAAIMPYATVPSADDVATVQPTSDTERRLPLTPPHDDFGETRYGRYRHASDAERECLARAVYYEARGEGFLGQVAVAQVILNRVRSRKWPDTVCGVVNQGESRGVKCQFSYVCFKNLSPPTGDPWERAKMVADHALQGGAYLRELEHATHYHTTAVAPIWRHALVNLTTIGSHIFYQEPGGVVEARGPALAALPKSVGVDDAERPPVTIAHLLPAVAAGNSGGISGPAVMMATLAARADDTSTGAGGLPPTPASAGQTLIAGPMPAAKPASGPASVETAAPVPGIVAATLQPASAATETLNQPLELTDPASVRPGKTSKSAKNRSKRRKGRG